MSERVPYQEWPPNSFSPVGHNRSNHTWDASEGRANLSALADRYASSSPKKGQNESNADSRPSSPPNRLPSSLNPEGSVFGWSGVANNVAGSVRERRPPVRQRAAKVARGCGAQCMLFLEATGLFDARRMFPIIGWPVKRRLTVGMMVLPQGIAYASIAGLPNYYGLYSSFMGVIVYCFMGSSRDISLGPTALMSLIVAAAFTELEHPPAGTANTCLNATRSLDYCCEIGGEYYCTPTNKAVAASMVAGLLQVAMGVLNLGVVVDFIGNHVLNGFTSAAAVTILTSQLKHIFGLAHVRREWRLAVLDIFSNLKHTRYQDVLMGVSAMTLTYFLKQLNGKYSAVRDDSRKNYLLWLAGTARNALVVLVGLVIAAIAAGASGTDETFRLVREIPAGLPSVVNPLHGVDDYGDVLRASVVIALLGYLENIAIGKAFAQQNGYVLDATQELRAVGTGNIVSSFFQSYPVTGSFSRTAVNSASNAQTPASGLITGILVIIALNTLTKAFYYIPKAALAAIIMMSVVHMIDIPTLQKIAKTKVSDLIVWSTSFFLCLLWSLEMGILVAIGVSFVLQEIATSTQPLHRLKRTSDHHDDDDDDGHGYDHGNISAGGRARARSHSSAGAGAGGRASGSAGIAGSAGSAGAGAFNGAGAGTGAGAGGTWEIDEQYEIVGMPSTWSKPFTADTVADGYIVLKLTGSLTFSMANVLKDRLANILLHLRSGGQTTAIVFDFATVPAIDFTGALALKSILDEAKPAKRKVPLGANGGTVKRPYFGTLIYVTHVQPSVHTVLVGAGLFSGNLDHGAWTLLECMTIDGALESFEVERERVDARFPFSWDMPAERAFEMVEGEVLVGADGKAWVVSGNGRGGGGGSKGLRWTRNFGNGNGGGGRDGGGAGSRGAGINDTIMPPRGRRESRRERIRRRLNSAEFGVDDGDNDAEGDGVALVRGV